MPDNFTQGQNVDLPQVREAARCRHELNNIFKKKMIITPKQEREFQEAKNQRTVPYAVRNLGKTGLETIVMSQEVTGERRIICVI